MFLHFSHSANLLVSLQYFFVEGTCLVFFFSWRTLFRPGRMITWLVFILFFANPLLLYCCNYLISDPIFIGLSLLWLTQLLWIICRPRPYMILTHALLLSIAFTIRYNALYYPIIGALAFVLSRQRLRLKLCGIGLPLLLIGCFVWYTSIEVGKATGQRQFSAFGSWKLANDALYIYSQVPRDEIEPVPVQFRVLDSITRSYLQDPLIPIDLSVNDFTSGSFFMYALNSPLVTYLRTQYGGDFYFLNTRRYWQVAPLYQSYAVFLIRKYPGAFARHFLWPNFLRYYTPPREIFGSLVSYQLIEEYGVPYMHQVFNLTTITPKPSSIQLSSSILKVYPIVMALIHFAFLFGLVSFFLTGMYRKIGHPYKYCILLIAALWVCDLGFSVLSAGVVLRYQLFMMFPELAFGVYFIEYVSWSLGKRAPLAVT
jgi:hypothetical protein